MKKKLKQAASIFLALLAMVGRVPDVAFAANPTPVSYSIGGTVEVAGPGNLDRPLEFEIMDTTPTVGLGEAMPDSMTAKTDANYRFAFDKIKFSKAGTYEFRIWQVPLEEFVTVCNCGAIFYTTTENGEKAFYNHNMAHILSGEADNYWSDTIELSNVHVDERHWTATIAVTEANGKLSISKATYKSSDGRTNTTGPEFSTTVDEREEPEIPEPPKEPEKPEEKPVGVPTVRYTSDDGYEDSGNFLDMWERAGEIGDGTLTLLGNVSFSDSLVTNCNITIDLHGYDLAYVGANTGLTANSYNALTITDSVSKPTDAVTADHAACGYNQNLKTLVYQDEDHATHAVSFASVGQFLGNGANSLISAESTGTVVLKGGVLSNANMGVSVTSGYFSMTGGVIANMKQNGVVIENAAKNVSISGGYFVGNVSPSNGAAISNHGAITIKGDTVFASNSSGKKGGAVFNDGECAVKENAKFLYNFAMDGGAVYNAAKLAVSGNVLLSENRATNGGGIYVASEDTTLKNSLRLSENGGGDLYLASGTSVLVGKLDETVSVFVMAESKENLVLIARWADDGAMTKDFASFTSVDDSYSILSQNDGIYLEKRTRVTTPARMPVCHLTDGTPGLLGFISSVDSDDEHTFIPLSGFSSLLNMGFDVVSYNGERMFGFYEKEGGDVFVPDAIRQENGEWEIVLDKSINIDATSLLFLPNGAGAGIHSWASIQHDNGFWSVHVDDAFETYVASGGGFIFELPKLPSNKTWELSEHADDEYHAAFTSMDDGGMKLSLSSVYAPVWILSKDYAATAPDDTERPGDAEKPDDTERPDNTEQPDETEKPEKPEDTEKPVDTEQPDNTEKPDDADVPAKIPVCVFADGAIRAISSAKIYMGNDDKFAKLSEFSNLLVMQWDFDRSGYHGEPLFGFQTEPNGDVAVFSSARQNGADWEIPLDASMDMDNAKLIFLPNGADEGTHSLSSMQHDNGFWSISAQDNSDQAHAFSFPYVASGRSFTFKFGRLLDGWEWAAAEHEEADYHIDLDVEDGRTTLTLSNVYAPVSIFTKKVETNAPDETEKTKYGELEVSKTVTGKTDVDEFTFMVELKDEFGANLTKDVSFVKTDASGSEIEHGVFTNGIGNVTLSDGDRVRISQIPMGCVYTVTEEDYECSTRVTVDKTESESRVTTGTILAQETVTIAYVNRYSSVSMPNTGSNSLYWVSGIGFILLAMGCFAGYSLYHYQKNKR